MKTAKIFKNGRSSAVRLPKEYSFASKEVYIQKLGDMVVLVPRQKSWDTFIKSLDGFSDDFMQQRVDEYPQKRKEL